MFSCLADVRSVVGRLAEEGYLDRPRPAAAPDRSRLRRIHLKITSRCNLACAHCLDSCSPAAEAGLSQETIFSLIDQSADLGAAGLALSGGEPFVRPDLRDVLRHAAERMAIVIATNGTLIDASWADFFSEVPADLQISLDGPTAEIHDSIRGRGAFARTMRAIEILGKAGLKKRMTLATTIQGPNLGAIDSMISLARNLEVPRLRFLPLSPFGRARDGWTAGQSARRIERSEELYDLLRRSEPDPPGGLEISSGLSGFVVHPPRDASGDDFWCPVGTMLVVSPEGEAYPCSLLGRPEFSLGNVHRLSLGRIVGSPAWNNIGRALAERRDRIEQCASCPWKNLCQAGCMGLAFGRNGSVWGTDDHCAYRKRAYSEAFTKILERPAPVR